MDYAVDYFVSQNDQIYFPKDVLIKFDDDTITYADPWYT